SQIFNDSSSLTPFWETCNAGLLVALANFRKAKSGLSLVATGSLTSSTCSHQILSSLKSLELGSTISNFSLQEAPANLNSSGKQCLLVPTISGAIKKLVHMPLTFKTAPTEGLQS